VFSSSSSTWAFTVRDLDRGTCSERCYLCTAIYFIIESALGGTSPMPHSSSTLRRSYGRLTSLRWRTKRETQSSRILWKLLMLGLSCESTFLPRLVQREKVDVWFFASALPIRFCVDALYRLIVASCLVLQKCRLLLRKRGSCCRLVRKVCRVGIDFPGYSPVKRSGKRLRFHSQAKYTSNIFSLLSL